MSVRSKSTINDRITSINQRQSLQDQKLCRSEANQLLMIVFLWLIEVIRSLMVDLLLTDITFDPAVIVFG